MDKGPNAPGILEKGIYTVDAHVYSVNIFSLANPTYIVYCIPYVELHVIHDTMYFILFCLINHGATNFCVNYF